jgi:glycosyltransferase involved in cell wall biosynthesis
LKVAFITHYPNLYGANRSLLDLIEGLRKYGVRPYVILPSRGEILTVLQEKKIPFAIIHFRFWIDTKKEKTNLWTGYYNAAKRLRQNFKEIPRFEKQLKEWEIELVYTNTSVIPVGALIAKKLNLPHVWHLREFIDLDYGFKLDWGKLSLNLGLRQARAIVANSEAIASYHTKDLERQKVSVIYNGINTLTEFDRLYELRQLIERDNKVYTFAVVGLIQPGKGQDVAIKALGILAKDYPQIRLLLAGSLGPAQENYGKELQELVKSFALSEKVEFLGHVDDPYKVYWAADALLMCSRSEAMGRVTVEAMSASLPVIGYDNAGTAEIIEPEKTGLLYRGGAEELASCMRRLVENSFWAKQLGEQAWKTAREKYSVEVYAQKVYEVLRSLDGFKQ